MGVEKVTKSYILSLEAGGGGGNVQSVESYNLSWGERGVRSQSGVLHSELRGWRRGGGGVCSGVVLHTEM